MTESPANKSNTVSPPSGCETYGAEAQEKRRIIHLALFLCLSIFRISAVQA